MSQKRNNFCPLVVFSPGGAFLDSGPQLRFREPDDKDVFVNKRSACTKVPDCPSHRVASAPYIRALPRSVSCVSLVVPRTSGDQCAISEAGWCEPERGNRRVSAGATCAVGKCGRIENR